MKRTAIFALSLLTLLFASCSADMDETPDEDIEIAGAIINVGCTVALVDRDLQDRLNPESPAYFGDEYAGGIEVLYPYKGRKIRYPDLLRYTADWVTLENYTTIQPPFRETADGAVRQNPFDYYYLSISLFFTEFSEDGFARVYIQHPDGSEDEVKIKVYRNERGNIQLNDKIWFNDELVYEMRTKDGKSDPDYYNPAFYPVLEPVLDDEGKQIGEHVRPLAEGLIVVVK
ncbi:MAG: hypothetical protein LBS04_02250 [Tannerellaceae bacterium]|nr:hypothetical protein [Tannerellaceae bacterium]